MVLKQSSIQSNRHNPPAIFKMYFKRLIKGTIQRLEPNFTPFKESILILSGHYETLLLILLMAFEPLSVLNIKED